MTQMMPQQQQAYLPPALETPAAAKPATPASAAEEDPLRMTLGPVLEKANLTQYKNELMGMGAVTGDDLQHMTDQDLEGLGMKKLEISRLRRNLKG